MLKAGFYEVDISPSVLMSCTSFESGTLEGMASPPRLTASVWQTDQLKIGIVGADICVIQRQTWQSALAILQERFGFDALLCAASHAHSAGPGIRDWVLPLEEVAEISDIDPELRADLYRIHEKGWRDKDTVPDATNRLYLDLLVCRIVDAVVCAEKRLEEVKLIMGRDVVRDVGHNRRQKIRQGYTVSHAGKGNPDIVGNAGPIDDEVVALGAVNSKGDVIGVLVNYACHATVAGSKEGFSADWPYYLRETIRKMISPETVTVFLNGCCGDVTQVDNISLDPHRRGERWAKILGQRVAFPVVDILCREDAHEFDVLKTVSCDLELEWRTISDERYREALHAVNSQGEGCWFAVGVVLHKIKAEKEPHAVCNLNVVQIGNLVIATNPVEAFARIGMDIKAGSPFEFTMTVELTNDWLGYMPTEDAFGPTGGGYEPQLKGGTCLEIGAARKVTDKLVEMVNACTPEKTIDRPQVEKRGRTNPRSVWHARPEAI